MDARDVRRRDEHGNMRLSGLVVRVYTGRMRSWRWDDVVELDTSDADAQG